MKNTSLFTALMIVAATASQVLANPGIPTPDAGASAVLLAVSVAGLGLAKKLIKR